MPGLASFTDSKLLDFSDGNSMTLHINRMFCVMCCIRYLRINACAVSTVTIIDECLPRSQLSTDEADNSGFFSIRRVCMVSYRSNKTTSSSPIRSTVAVLTGSA